MSAKVRLPRVFMREEGETHYDLGAPGWNRTSITSFGGRYPIH